MPSLVLCIPGLCRQAQRQELDAAQDARLGCDAFQAVSMPWAHQIKGSGHDGGIVGDVDDNDGPGGHLQAQQDHREEEEAQDEQAAGNAVDDVGLQARKDDAARPDGCDDGAQPFLRDIL